MCDKFMQRIKQAISTVSFSGPTSGVILFCFLFSLYSLTIHARLRYGDETERYLQAQSLVDRQSWVIRAIPGHERITDGKNYSQFEMGYGVLLVPPYILGRAVSHFFPSPDLDAVPLIFVSLLNPAITALTAVFLFWFSRALGVGHRISLAVALLYGLGTLAWPYTMGLYREPLQAFTLLVAVYAFYLFRQSGKERYYWFAAVSFGYLVFTKVANAAMLPLFGLYGLWALYENSKQNLTRGGLVAIIVRGLAFALPMAVFLGIQGAVNVAKFGDVLEIGPSNYRSAESFFSLATVGDGVIGFLFSPEKSLFLYAPPVLLFLPAWVAFLRKNGIDALFILSLIVLNFLLNAAYLYWGSVNWGPRYLVLTVPLLILPVGLLLEHAQGRARRWWGMAGVAVLFAGLFVQIVAALTDDREVLETMGRGGDLAGVLDLLRHHSIDSLILGVAPDGNVLVSNLFGWGLLAFTALLGLGLFVRVARQVSMLYGSPGYNVTAFVILIGLLFGGLIYGVVDPYPRILQAKADAKYVAANSYFSENRFCEAQALYLKALYLGTSTVQASRTRLEQITPEARGTIIPVTDRMTEILNPDAASVERDPDETLFGDGALRIQAAPGKEINSEVDSQFIDAKPNTPYVLSGWQKTQGLYGSGGAIVGWYEDNGNWGHVRGQDIQNVIESRGWQPFRTTITTLPTTRRILIKVGLWHEYGTLWTDGLELVEIEAGGPLQPPPLCVNALVEN